MNCGDQVRLHMRLDNVAQAAYRQTGANKFIFRVNREEDHFRRRPFLAQLMCRLDAAQPGHGYVGHDHVGVEPHSLRDHFGTGVSRPNNVEYRSQELGYSLRDGEMIIGQQDTCALQLGWFVHS